MSNTIQDQALKESYRRRGMGIGMIIFTPFGIALWLTTGNPGLLGIGPAVGIPVGISIGDAMYKRHMDHSDDSR